MPCRKPVRRAWLSDPRRPPASPARFPASTAFIVLGGPLSDEHRVVHAVEAESEEEIRAKLAEDLWSGSHLVVDTIDPWTIRLDGRERR
jgi:hypothetical protein